MKYEHCNCRTCWYICFPESQKEHLNWRAVCKKSWLPKTHPQILGFIEFLIKTYLLLYVTYFQGVSLIMQPYQWVTNPATQTGYGLFRTKISALFDRKKNSRKRQQILVIWKELWKRVCSVWISVFAPEPYIFALLVQWQAMCTGRNAVRLLRSKCWKNQTISLLSLRCCMKSAFV